MEELVWLVQERRLKKEEIQIYINKFNVILENKNLEFLQNICVNSALCWTELYLSHDFKTILSHFRWLKFKIFFNHGEEFPSHEPEF